MTEVSIYHNPRCSKSRKTLEILQENNIYPEIILYLETPPGKAQLINLLSLLGIRPRELLRSSEQAYRDRGLSDLSLSDDALIDAMIDEPRLIERPIVVVRKKLRNGTENKAVLGRPPENVLDII